MAGGKSAIKFKQESLDDVLQKFLHLQGELRGWCREQTRRVASDGRPEQAPARS